MKKPMKKNVLILSLIIIGVIGISAIEMFIKPELDRQEQQYQEEQRNPLTHDFNSVLKYKNQYMGNASNMMNLNNHLPLQQIGRTYQLYPDTLTAEINYEESSASIDETMLIQSLLYNATANFVLIDNLQTLKFNFTDHTYTFTGDRIHIRIVARKEGEDILFYIIDDGMGMRPKRLKEILNSSSESETGYGIRNIDQRIKLQYGLMYGVSIWSRPGIGTAVQIRIPAKKRKLFLQDPEQ